MLGLQQILYGTLRPIEVEQLYEKGWFAVTETCLAMTIFREEVGGWFLIMFVSLLIGKVWGWIGDGRVEILEQQPPSNPRLFHTRLCTSLMISSIFDVAMLSYSVKTVLQHARPNMMVMFAFEFAVLCVTSFSTSGRYLISLREAYIIQTQTAERRAQLEQERDDRARNQASDTTSHDSSEGRQNSIPESDSQTTLDAADIDVPGWEEKGRWVFYLELTTGEFRRIPVRPLTANNARQTFSNLSFTWLSSWSCVCSTACRYTSSAMFCLPCDRSINESSISSDIDRLRGTCIQDILMQLQKRRRKKIAGRERG